MDEDPRLVRAQQMDAAAAKEAQAQKPKLTVDDMMVRPELRGMDSDLANEIREHVGRKKAMGNLVKYGHNCPVSSYDSNWG